MHSKRAGMHDPAEEKDMEMDTTVTLNRSLPIDRRLTEAGRQLRSWLKSLGTPYENSFHRLRSKGFERRGQEVVYHYVLRPDVEDGGTTS